MARLSLTVSAAFSAAGETGEATAAATSTKAINTCERRQKQNALSMTYKDGKGASERLEGSSLLLWTAWWLTLAWGCRSVYITWCSQGTDRCWWMTDDSGQRVRNFYTWRSRATDGRTGSLQRGFAKPISSHNSGCARKRFAADVPLAATAAAAAQDDKKSKHRSRLGPIRVCSSCVLIVVTVECVYVWVWVLLLYHTLTRWPWAKTMSFDPLRRQTTSLVDQKKPYLSPKPISKPIPKARQVIVIFNSAKLSKKIRT